MKKIIIFFVSIFITITSFSQIDIDTLNNIDKEIVKTFKDLYVDKTFKDPYSFKLMKFVKKPVTMGVWRDGEYNSGLLFWKSYLEKKDFSVYSEKHIKEMIEILELSYSNMSDYVRNKIKSYIVYIDCYGTNSYGGKVLGRYSFNYNLIYRDVSKEGNSINIQWRTRDYYKDPSEFKVSVDN